MNITSRMTVKTRLSSKLQMFNFRGISPMVHTLDLRLGYTLRFFFIPSAGNLQAQIERLIHSYLNVYQEKKPKISSCTLRKTASKVNPSYEDLTIAVLKFVTEQSHLGYQVKKLLHAAFTKHLQNKEIFLVLVMCLN